MKEYASEEITHICGEITRRVNGALDDPGFKSFQSLISYRGIACRDCEDTGVYWDGLGMTVCMRCNYHGSRGRKMSRTKPESVK